jgi:hypothetical protein
MTSDFVMPCGPEAVLPAQVSWGVRWDADTAGPHALMLAVLEDAIRCIENGRWRRRFGARRLAAEAEAWVRCDRADWPFSFLNICEALGIDVESMRRWLLIPHPAPGEHTHAGRRQPMTIARCHACAHGGPRKEGGGAQRNDSMLGC